MQKYNQRVKKIKQLDSPQRRQGKVPVKHSLHGKIAASVLLKPFINGNERCHTETNLIFLGPNICQSCKACGA